MKPQAKRPWVRLIAGTALFGLVAAGCGVTDQPAASPESSVTVHQETNPSIPSSEAAAPEPRRVSAEEGVLARTRYEPLQRSTEAASGALVAKASTMDCPSTYVPTAEEVAEANTPNDGLIDAFERFGIEYTSSTNGLGYLAVDYPLGDVVAQSVADSYWNARYPVTPISQDELDAAIEQNNIVATNSKPQASPTSGTQATPGTSRSSTTMTTRQPYFAILDDLYPPITIEPVQECEPVAEPIDMPTPDVQAVDPLIDPMPVDELGEAPVDVGPTSEQMAQNAAEIDAIVAGLTSAAVVFELVGDAPWQTVVFDLEDASSVAVITDVLAARA